MALDYVSVWRKIQNLFLLKLQVVENIIRALLPTILEINNLYKEDNHYTYIAQGNQQGVSQEQKVKLEDKYFTLVEAELLMSFPLTHLGWNKHVDWLS